jgi:hypothetical protein
LLYEEEPSVAAFKHDHLILS